MNTSDLQDPAFCLSLPCLRGHAQQRITHGHLFHSVLGRVHVGTALYRRSLDAYAAGAAHRAQRR